MRRLVLFSAALAALALPASAQKASAPAPPPVKGVHVVGEWTLTVLGPDGSVVDRREFRNDYVGGGWLPALLAGDRTVGNWSVDLQAPAGAPSPCADAEGARRNCRIREPDPDYFLTAPFLFDNLTVGIVSGDGTSYLRLVGNMTSSSEGTIQSVSTGVSDCDPTVAPAECGEAEFAGSGPFTRRDLGAEALPVAAGQTVNVQVDISFE